MVRVRSSRAADVSAIASIYAHHVRCGTGTFEEVAPSLEDMGGRRDEVLARGLPFLVATVPSSSSGGEAGASEGGETVVGYAYANLFRTRTAYRFTLENSIYVHPDYCGAAGSRDGRGVGRALLERLLELLRAAGYRQVLAVIGDADNAASIGLHTRFGFKHVGTMRRVGRKFGRWIDVVIMQLELQPESNKDNDNSAPNDPKPCAILQKDETTSSSSS